MSFTTSLLSQTISRRPLPKQDRSDPRSIARWIDAAAPSMARGDRQTADATRIIIAHLRTTGVTDSNIGAALASSAYQFTLDVRDATIAVHMAGQAARQPATASSGPPVNLTPNQPATMGSAQKPDPASLKFKAAALDVKFHNAEMAGDMKAMRDLTDLLLQILANADDLIKEKERIRAVQAEILLNAPNIARNVRPFGPAERPVPGPDGRVPRYRLQMLPPRVRTSRTRR